MFYSFLEIGMQTSHTANWQAQCLATHSYGKTFQGKPDQSSGLFTEDGVAEMSEDRYVI